MTIRFWANRVHSKKKRKRGSFSKYKYKITDRKIQNQKKEKILGGNLQTLEFEEVNFKPTKQKLFDENTRESYQNPHPSSSKITFFLK